MAPPSPANHALRVCPIPSPLRPNTEPLFSPDFPKPVEATHGKPVLRVEPEEFAELSEEVRKRFRSEASLLNQIINGMNPVPIGKMETVSGPKTVYFHPDRFLQNDLQRLTLNGEVPLKAGELASGIFVRNENAVVSLNLETKPGAVRKATVTVEGTLVREDAFLWLDATIRHAHLREDGTVVVQVAFHPPYFFDFSLEPDDHRFPYSWINGAHQLVRGVTRFFTRSDRKSPPHIVTRTITGSLLKEGIDEIPLRYDSLFTLLVGLWTDRRHEEFLADDPDRPSLLKATEWDQAVYEARFEFSPEGALNDNLSSISPLPVSLPSFTIKGTGTGRSLVEIPHMALSSLIRLPNGPQGIESLVEDPHLVQIEWAREGDNNTIRFGHLGLKIHEGRFEHYHIDGAETACNNGTLQVSAKGEVIQFNGDCTIFGGALKVYNADRRLLFAAGIREARETEDRGRVEFLGMNGIYTQDQPRFEWNFQRTAIYGEGYFHLPHLGGAFNDLVRFFPTASGYPSLDLGGLHFASGATDPLFIVDLNEAQPVAVEHALYLKPNHASGSILASHHMKGRIDQIKKARLVVRKDRSFHLGPQETNLKTTEVFARSRVEEGNVCAGGITTTFSGSFNTTEVRGGINPPLLDITSEMNGCFRVSHDSILSATERARSKIIVDLRRVVHPRVVHPGTSGYQSQPLDFLWCGTATGVVLQRPGPGIPPIRIKKGSRASGRMIRTPGEK
ncbi:MAG: hypothetical protein HYS22_00955 [Deltaproteobacteria bacterium]|nr:hypothetical protein [Deltaproteobacteria bacterium]